MIKRAFHQHSRAARPEISCSVAILDRTAIAWAGRLSCIQTRMRLFIGLPLPEKVAASLAKRARNLALPQARLSPPENLHITLVFLGQVQEDRLPAIQDQLARIDSPPVEVTIGDLGSFPGAGVLFAQVQPAPELLRLQAQVTACMDVCGFAPDSRPFNPHITLARSRGPLKGITRGSGGAHEPQRFLSTAVNLYRSVTSATGARYEVLATQVLQP